MPFLGEYIGHLLSEITTARMQADLEVAHVAEMYAQHPLLKHMPVPRFRLPNLTIDVPVLVSQLTEGKPAVVPQPLPAPNVNPDRVSAAAIAAAETSAKPLSQKVKDEVKRAIGSLLSRHDASGLTAAEAEDLARAAANATIDAARAELPAAKVDGIRESIRGAIVGEITRRFGVGAALPNPSTPTPAEPPRLLVGVTTRELREAGPPEILAKLRLTVTEDAMEWSFSDSSGQRTGRLVPE